MSRNVARGLGFGIGLAIFAGTHATEVAMWSAWFGGSYDAWFLNSGRAIVFTMAGLFTASLVAGVVRVSGVAITAGAVTAMIVIFALGPGSTIFPIVLSAGALIIAAPCLLGAWLGSEISRWRSSSR